MAFISIDDMSIDDLLIDDLLIDDLLIDDLGYVARRPALFVKNLTSAGLTPIILFQTGFQLNGPGKMGKGNFYSALYWIITINYRDKLLLRYITRSLLFACTKRPTQSINRSG